MIEALPNDVAQAFGPLRFDQRNVLRDVGAVAFHDQANLNQVTQHFLHKERIALSLLVDSFGVAQFSGVLMPVKKPEQALELAFRCLKSGGMLAAREAQKAGDWFSGPSLEAIALLDSIVVESHRSHGGDPYLGRRLASLAGGVGFQRVEATPSYSAAPANVRATAATMQTFQQRPDFRAIALECGTSAERLDRLSEDISSWANGEDSVAAFAECAVIGWKP